MPSHGKRGSDAAIVGALAAGKFVAEAAEAGGVSTSTVYRRLRDPEFMGKVRKARAQLLDRALGRISEAATLAVDKLRELLEADADSIQLGAARAILEHLTRLGEHAELANRVAEIEEAVKRQSYGGNQHV